MQRVGAIRNHNHVHDTHPRILNVEQKRVPAPVPWCAELGVEHVLIELKKTVLDLTQGPVTPPSLALALALPLTTGPCTGLEQQRETVPGPLSCVRPCYGPLQGPLHGIHGT